MNRIALLFGMVLLVALPGCESSADRIVNEQITLQDEMADAYDNDAPPATIADIQRRMDENDRRLDELKLSHNAKQTVLLKHQEDLKIVSERLNEAKKKYQLRHGEKK